MLEAAYIWMAVFAAAALAFFGVAIIVAWKGFGDLKGLLNPSDEKEARGKEVA